MYQDHFGMHADPFALGPNLKFLYRSAAHAETMAHLGYGLEQGEDFILISGAIGTGKTLALQNLLAKVSKLFHQVLINVTQVSFTEFLKLVLHELGVAYPRGGDTADLLCLLKDRALAIKAEGRKILLVVDEAQNLDPETLEGIRLLTNIGQPDAQIFQIVLSGQPALDRLVDRPELSQLRQRIRIHYRLEPMTVVETGEYIAHRTRVAGCPEPLFTARAIEKIHRLSGGVPRLVNHLAGHALLAAFVDKDRRIDEKHVAAEGLPEAPAPVDGSAVPKHRLDGPDPTTAGPPSPEADVPEQMIPAAEIAEPEPSPAKPAEPPARPAPEPAGPELPPLDHATPASDRPAPRPKTRLKGDSKAAPAGPRSSGSSVADTPRRRSLGWVWIWLFIILIGSAGAWILLRDQVDLGGDGQETALVPTTDPPPATIQAEPTVDEEVEPAATEPEPAPEPEPVVTPAAAPAPIWLHVASFRDSLRADRYQGLLRQAGTSSHLRRVVLTDGEPWHRVLIGPYTVADEAEAEAGRLENTGLISFHRLLQE